MPSRYACPEIFLSTGPFLKTARSCADATKGPEQPAVFVKGFALDSNANVIRIGQILIEQNVLSEQQVFEILEAQRLRNLPFGVLAEQMFDITLESIERAWVEQYHRFTGSLDLEDMHVDAEALKIINRRQAWQFEILPLHYEESGELLMAASRARLARAVTFAAARLKPVVYFRVAESEQLRAFLKKHYPMPEVTQEIIRRAREMADHPMVG